MVENNENKYLLTIKKKNQEIAALKKELTDLQNSNEKAFEHLLKLSECRTFKIASYIHSIPLPIENTPNILRDDVRKLITVKKVKDKDSRDNNVIFNKIKKYDDDFSKNYVFNTNWIDRQKKYGSVNRELEEILNKNKNKKIIIYPSVIEWKPFQTPQQLLIAFSQKGYLCLFCKYAYKDSKIEKLANNIYSVSEDIVISTIGNREVTIMLTWMASVPFALSFSKKKIWYHVLDQLDIFDLYGKAYLVCHKHMVKYADLVTYVSEPLAKCCTNAKKQFQLANGVNANDIINKKYFVVPKDMRPIIKNSKPIIGYFGWIEYWFDFDVVYRIASKHSECNFVFIGPSNNNNEIVKNGMAKLEQLQNIFFLGRKNYYDLPKYAKHFTIGIIPFLINDMMNCVSPIKFYEYCAYGIPTISSYMKEMDNYKCEYISCYRTYDEFDCLIDKFLNKKILDLARTEAIKIAISNSWLSRVEKVGNSL